MSSTSARIVFLPSFQGNGEEGSVQYIRTHIPREVAFVGVDALPDSPAIPLLKRIGTMPW